MAAPRFRGPHGEHLDMDPQTTALVIETNNLSGGLNGGSANVIASLARLLTHLRDQRRAIATLTEFVITHEGALADADRALLCDAAGRALTFYKLADGASYYDAKEAGFDATSADVVVFGDSDCWPDEQWLSAILAPFDDERVQAVAGRTCYRGDLLGTAATTIDFMHFKSPLGERCTRNFYANNVAFRRAVFDGVRYRDGEGFYRGNCQVAGIKLVEQGVAVRFEPKARTTHRFPDSARELMKLRLLRGEDTVVLKRHLKRALPRGARWALELGPVSTAAVLAGRFASSVASLNRQDMPEVRGARRAACVALIAGLSLVDAAGAVRGTLGGRARRRAHGKIALSYHGDVDAL